MTEQPEYPERPVQPMAPDQERMWATLTHAISGAAMLFSAGSLGFVVALVIYFALRDRGPFIRAHAASAVNIQLTALIGLVISALLVLVLVGLITYPLVVVGAVILHAIAALRANDGQWYNPPFTIRFVS